MKVLDWLGALLKDPEIERKRAFLEKLPLFKGIPSREIGHVYQALYPRTYHQGEVLFEEGDIGRALFILESGAVELSKKGPDGKPKVIATLEPGDYFGEMALLEERPRLASAVAVQETRVYMLYKAKLEALFDAAPRIAVAITMHLAQVLSGRLRKTTEQLVRAK